MKLKKLLPMLAIVVLVCALCAGTAGAYFTSYAEAEGGRPFTFEYVTELTESFDSWTKNVVITCSADSDPMYVRARAFAGADYKLTYTGDGWTEDDDGWYYCDAILQGDGTNPGSTAGLKIAISNVPTDAVEGDSFNVIVVYEITPVMYDTDGSALPADWSLALTSDNG